MKIDKTKQSPNYSVYNGVTKRTVKTAVCMHKTVGSFSGAIEWLCTTPDQRLKRHGKKSWSSAHTIDDRNDPGVIHQIIPFSHRAWHAGGVVRRTKRAMDVIGVLDPNNVSIGHEMAAVYDADKNGVTSEEEKRATLSQLDDFVEFMFELEEESKTNEWLDITADASSLFTHYDVNPYKPDMEFEYAYVIAKMKERKGGVQIAPSLALEDANWEETMQHLDDLYRK